MTDQWNDSMRLIDCSHFRVACQPMHVDNRTPNEVSLLALIRTVEDHLYNGQFPLNDVPKRAILVHVYQILPYQKWFFGS
jgi:hypothetical protein